MLYWAYAEPQDEIHHHLWLYNKNNEDQLPHSVSATLGVLFADDLQEVLSGP